MNTLARISKPLMIAVLVLAILTFSALVVNAGGTARFITIDYPAAVYTVAYGINPSGEIVGEYKLGTTVHGYLLRDGEFTTIDYPGSVWTQAWGINPQGDIVGQYMLSGDVNIHGFFLQEGTFYNIDILGRANTMPSKISPDGTIVGCTHGTGYMYGFVMDAEGVTLDQTGVGISFMHTGVNPSGDIVGNSTDPATGRFINSYIIAEGVITSFTSLGSRVTRAWDISPNGDVVGFYRDPSPSPSYPFHGFLYHKGEMTSIDVDVNGVTGTQAYGISATGDIVGYYNVGSAVHGFLRTTRKG